MSQNIADSLTEGLTIRVVTVEYAIVLHLYDVSNVSAGELCTVSGASTASFYSKLKQMLAAGLLCSSSSATDRRVKLYSLSQRARKILDEEYQFLPDWMDRKLAGNNLIRGELIKFINRASQRLDIKFFSTEYEILIDIYDHFTLSCKDIISLNQSSPTSVYNALKCISDAGLITVNVDEQDSRKRLYQLNEPVRRFLNDQHVELSRWISSHISESSETDDFARRLVTSK